tara:strand:+ start:157 stop:792 length:636 start_codon:yes stop_codon:yes gene_type:complete
MSDNHKKINVGIINLGFNNLYSIFNCVKDLGYKTNIVNSKNKNIHHDIIILPGVGSYPKAMNYLNYSGLKDKIYNFVEKKNKLLFGICLGMQLLFDESSEFKRTKGLSLIEGSVKKFDKKKLIVPNIGWNKLIIPNKKKFTGKFDKNKFYYFVHSYYCKPTNNEDIAAISLYKNFIFCSAIHKKNILGAQFHPEKSGDEGQKILKNLYKLL